MDSEIMEHQQASDLLSEYLEGDLPPDQVAALERHLESCQECSQTLAMLKQALRVVSRMPQASAPEHFARRVQLRARRAGLLRSRRQHLMERMTAPFSSVLATWGLLLAVGLLLVVVMIAQQQIELLTLPAPAPIIELDKSDHLASIEALAKNLGIQIEPKIDPDDPLELAIEVDGWPAFVQAMQAAGLAERLLPQPPGTRPDGRIHLRFRLAAQPAGEGTGGDQSSSGASE